MNRKITREDIRKMNLQVNQYFKKEKFIFDNLNNNLYDFKIKEISFRFLIKYKRTKNQKYKEFNILKNFFTFDREYRITREKILILKDYLKKQKRI